jgi:histone H2B
MFAYFYFLKILRVFLLRKKKSFFQKNHHPENMPPTKGGQRPPKGGKGSGKGGKRAPLPGSVTVNVAGGGGGGKASLQSGGTKTNRRSSKKAASHSKAGKKKTSKPRRKAPWQRWATYIHKLQRTDRNIGLSRRAMAIVGAFVEDMFERLTTQASQIARMNKLVTVTAKEVQTAARLVLPPDFASHSMSEGTRAVNRYTQAREQPQE